MSNIRLIISDIDGTILTSNHQVDEQLIELMPKLEKANKKYENLINEIKEMIDETKESIIKYSQLKFHEE